MIKKENNNKSNKFKLKGNIRLWLILLLSIIFISTVGVYAWLNSRVQYVRQQINLATAAMDVEVYNDNAEAVYSKLTQTDNDMGINTIKTLGSNNFNVNTISSDPMGTITIYAKVTNTGSVKLSLYLRMFLSNISDKNFYNTIQSYMSCSVIDITGQVKNATTSYAGNGDYTGIEAYVNRGYGDTRGETYANSHDGSLGIETYHTSTLFSLDNLQTIGVLDSNTTVYYRIELYNAQDNLLPSPLTSQVFDFSFLFYGKQFGQPLDDNGEARIYNVSTENEFLSAMSSAKSGSTIALQKDIEISRNITFTKAINLMLTGCSLTINGDLIYDYTDSTTTEIDLFSQSELHVLGNFVVAVPSASFKVNGESGNIGKVYIGNNGVGGEYYISAKLNTLDQTVGYSQKYVRIYNSTGNNPVDATMSVSSSTNVVIGTGSYIGKIDSVAQAEKIYIYVIGQVTGGIDLSDMHDLSNNIVESTYTTPSSLNTNGLDQIYINVSGQVGELQAGSGYLFQLPSWSSYYLNQETPTTKNSNTRIVFTFTSGMTNDRARVSIRNATLLFTGENIEVEDYTSVGNVLIRLNDSGVNTYNYNGKTYYNAYRLIRSDSSEAWDPNYGSANFYAQSYVYKYFNQTGSSIDPLFTNVNLTIEQKVASIDYFEVYTINDTRLSALDIKYLAGAVPPSTRNIRMSGMKHLNLYNCDVYQDEIVTDTFNPYDSQSRPNGAVITSVELPQNLVYIRTNAFVNSKIKEITIPENVISVGTGAFSNISVDNGYGGRLFVTLESKQQLTGDVINGFDSKVSGTFETNQKTYIFVPETVDTMYRNSFTMNYTNSKFQCDGRDLNYQNVSNKYWNYIFSYADLVSFSYASESSYEFIFTRTKGVVKELALILTSSKQNTIDTMDLFNAIYVTEIGGEIITSYGDRCFYNIGVTTINTKFKLSEQRPGLVKIGAEVFRGVKFTDFVDFGNVVTFGDYCFYGTTFEDEFYTIDMNFNSGAYLGKGAFSNLNTTNCFNNGGAFNITFLGYGTIGDECFYLKVADTMSKISNLQLGGVDSVGSYAFYNNRILYFAERTLSVGGVYEGMIHYGEYMFKNAWIGDGTNLATTLDWKTAEGNCGTVDFMPKAGVDISANAFNGAKFYGIIFNLQNLNEIKGDSFTGSKFYASKIDVTGTKKICKGAFFDVADFSYINKRVDLYAIDVPQIEFGAFDSTWGEVYIGLKSDDINENNVATNENYKWGSEDLFYHHNNDNIDLPAYGGIFANAKNLNCSGRVNNIAKLTIDGNIPINTIKMGLTGTMMRYPNQYVYYVAVSYDEVLITDNYTSNSIPEALFGTIYEDYVAEYGGTLNGINYNTIGKLTLPACVNTFNRYAFYRTKISELNIGVSSIYVSEYAFGTYNKDDAGQVYSMVLNQPNLSFTYLGQYGFTGTTISGVNTITINGLDIGTGVFHRTGFVDATNITISNCIVGSGMFKFSDLHSVINLNVTGCTVLGTFFHTPSFTSLQTLTYNSSTANGTYSFIYKTSLSNFTTASLDNTKISRLFESCSFNKPVVVNYSGDCTTTTERYSFYSCTFNDSFTYNLADYGVSNFDTIACVFNNGMILNIGKNAVHKHNYFMYASNYDFDITINVDDNGAFEAQDYWSTNIKYYHTFTVNLGKDTKFSWRYRTWNIYGNVYINAQPGATLTSNFLYDSIYYNQTDFTFNNLYCKVSLFGASTFYAAKNFTFNNCLFDAAQFQTCVLPVVENISMKNSRIAAYMFQTAKLGEELEEGKYVNIDISGAESVGSYIFNNRSYDKVIVDATDCDLISAYAFSASIYVLKLGVKDRTRFDENSKWHSTKADTIIANNGWDYDFYYEKIIIDGDMPTNAWLFPQKHDSHIQKITVNSLEFTANCGYITSNAFGIPAKNLVRTVYTVKNLVVDSAATVQFPKEAFSNLIFPADGNVTVNLLLEISNQGNNNADGDAFNKMLLYTNNINIGYDVPNNMFKNCEFLNETDIVAINSNGHRIGDSAFENTVFPSTITTFNLNNCTYIGTDAFKNTTLSNVALLAVANNAEIGSGAFTSTNLSGATTVTIGDSVEIGSGAFTSTNLSGATMVTIGDSAILGLTSFKTTNLANVTSFNIGEGSTIESWAFSKTILGKSTTSYVNISVGKNSIIRYAGFYKLDVNASYYPNLNAIDVKVIESCALSSCWHDVSVGYQTLNANVGEYGLAPDFYLKSVDTNTYLTNKQRGGGIFGKAQSTDIALTNTVNTLNVYLLPTNTNKYVFTGLYSNYNGSWNSQVTYKTVNIMNNVTTIPDYAFCLKLSDQKATIGTLNFSVSNDECDNVITKYGEYAFYKTPITTIHNFDIVDGCEIGDYSFYNTTMTGFNSLSIGDNVSIGDYAFNSTNLSSVQTLTAGNTITIGDYAFNSTNLSGVQTATLGNNITHGVASFKVCNSSSLTSLTYGNYATFDENSFEECDLSKLKTLIIGTNSVFNKHTFLKTKLNKIETLTIGSNSEINFRSFYQTIFGTQTSINPTITINSGSYIRFAAFHKLTTNDSLLPNLIAIDCPIIETSAFSNSWNEVSIGYQDSSISSSEGQFGFDANYTLRETGDNSWNTTQQYGGGMFAAAAVDNIALINKVNTLNVYRLPTQTKPYFFAGFYSNWSGGYDSRVNYGTVNIMSSCTLIPNYAFGCGASDRTKHITTIGTINFASSLTSIGTNAFYKTIITNFCNVSLGNSSSIGDNAFNSANITSMGSISLGNSSSIGTDCFLSCKVTGGSGTLSIGTNSTISDNSFKSAILSNFTSISIGNNITLNDNLFDNCELKYCTSIIMGNHTTLNKNSFYKTCLNRLTTLEIGESSEIKFKAFNETIIGLDAASNPNITIKKNSTVRFAGFHKISGNTQYLPNIYAVDVPYLEAAAFSSSWNVVSIGYLDLPSSTGIFGTDPNFKILDNSNSSYDTYDQLGAGLFAAGTLNDIALNNTVKVLNVYRLPDSVKPYFFTGLYTQNYFSNNWDSRVTYDTINLKAECTYIPVDAFRYGRDKHQTTINNLNIEGNLTSIGDYAFYKINIASCNTISLPDNSSVGEHAFDSAVIAGTTSPVSNLTFGNNVKIKTYAFNNATLSGFSTLSIGDSSTIATYAFNSAKLNNITSFTCGTGIIYTDNCFELSEMKSVTTVTFGNTSEFNRYSFHKANFDKVTAITFGQNSDIKFRSFFETYIGTNATTNPNITIGKGSSVRYSAFFSLTCNVAYLPNIMATDVPIIETGAFSNSWNNVSVGYQDDNILSSTGEFGLATGFTMPECCTDASLCSVAQTGGGIFANTSRSNSNILFTVNTLNIYRLPTNTHEYVFVGLKTASWGTGYNSRVNYTKVNIMSNCTIIPKNAFGDVGASTNITVGTLNYNSAITSIGDYAFYKINIASCNTISLPDNSSVGEHAFDSAVIAGTTSPVSNLTFGNNVNIKTYAFYKANISNVSAINFATGTSIGNSAFESTVLGNCTNIKFTGNNNIGTDVFKASNLSNLQTLNIGNNVILGSKSFYDLTLDGLTVFTVGDDFTAGTECFRSCDLNNLTSLAIGNNAKILSQSFREVNFDRLTTLSFGSNSELEIRCFKDAKIGRLVSQSTNISVGSGSSIKQGSFMINTPGTNKPSIDLTDVTTIESASLNSDWNEVKLGYITKLVTDGQYGTVLSSVEGYVASWNGGIFASDNNQVLSKTISSLTLYNLPNNTVDRLFAPLKNGYLIIDNLYISSYCTKIPNYAFATDSSSTWTTTINNLSCLSTNLVIGEYAFYYTRVPTSSKLWTLSGVTTIGDSAFYNVCNTSNTKTLTINLFDVITINGINTFNSSAITRVDLGPNFGVGSTLNPLLFTNATLTRLTLYTSPMISLTGTTIKLADSYKIYVPASLYSTYTTDTYWLGPSNNNLDNFVKLSNTDSTNTWGYVKVTNTSVALVSYIGADSSSINIPSTISDGTSTLNVVRLEKSLLETNCTLTTSITIPSSVTYIDPALFTGTNIAQITVSGNYSAEDNGRILRQGNNLIRVMPGAVFTDNKVTLSIKNICDGAFDGCTTIEEVIFTSSVSYLADNLFAYNNCNVNIWRFQSVRPPYMLGQNVFGSLISSSEINGVLEYTYDTNKHIYVPYGSEIDYQTEFGFTNYNVGTLISADPLS